jgi:hypothetical protein
MLTMDGSTGHREKLRQGTAGEPSTTLLSTNFIGRYRQFISKTELSFMQLFAGQQMVSNGYTLDPIKFSSREQLHFAFVDLPLNLVRMSAWLGLEAVQHRFPNLVGRRPSSNKTTSQSRVKAA